jgi:hypothetical protein
MRSRRPGLARREKGGDGGEGEGGSFLGMPSAVSRALPPFGLLTVSLTLSAMLVALVTAALVR